MTIGSNPAHFEEMRIGGGTNDATGGADFEKNGAITTTGDITLHTGALRTKGDTGDNPDLITNGAFESPYTSGVANGWTESDSGGVLTLSEETSDVYAGSSSQKYTRTSATAHNAYLVQNGIAITPGKIYRLSFAVKVLAGAIDALFIVGSTTGFQNLIFDTITDSEWTVKSIDFQLDDDVDGAGRLRIGTGLNGVATFLIDALSIKEISGGEAHFGHNVSVVGDMQVEGNLGTEEDSDLIKLNDGEVVVRGTIDAEGGAISAGVSGTTRGVVTALHGGSNKPGSFELISEDGTPHFIFVENDGTLRIHNALPTSNADGTIVGLQF